MIEKINFENIVIMHSKLCNPCIRFKKEIHISSQRIKLFDIAEILTSKLNENQVIENYIVAFGFGIEL